MASSPAGDQVGGVALTLGDDDGGAGAGLDDGRPVEVPAACRPENELPLTSYGEAGSVRGSFFGWSNTLMQLVADLLADQRCVGECVVGALIVAGSPAPQI